MVFCNQINYLSGFSCQTVTILILIDGFLQYYHNAEEDVLEIGHNPYFNRWFSAIGEILKDYNSQRLSQSLF